MLTIEGAGKEFAGGASAARVIALVPDGVAKVSFSVSAQPPNLRALTASVPVHGNIAAVKVDRDVIKAGMPAMTWYAADGHVIRRVGNP